MPDREPPWRDVYTTEVVAGWYRDKPGRIGAAALVVVLAIVAAMAYGTITGSDAPTEPTEPPLTLPTLVGPDST